MDLQITSFVILEEAPPILLIVIGLNNGCIYCIKGDIARERITRFKLQIDDPDKSPITGLSFRMDGQALLLFAVSPNSVSLFNFQSQPPRLQTIDQIGSTVNSVAMSDRSVCYFLIFHVVLLLHVENSFFISLNFSGTNYWMLRIPFSFH